MDLMILFGSLIVLLTLSIPIGIALGISTALTLYFSSDIPLIMIAQTAFAALDSFPLLAIPFFMLAGSLMSYGGISKRLVMLAEGLVGTITGGLAMVTTVACMFFAAISGSGPATVSAIGSFMIPAMKEKKYDEGFAAALTAAAGSIGVIIPPSIPFVIYCVIAGTSVADLFIAGIIPGIIIGLALMITSYFIAKKHGYPKSEKKQNGNLSLLRRMFEASWALMMPIIILGGIYGGVFTPTEAAVVGVAYALAVGWFVYGELDVKTTIAAFRESVLVNGATTFMIGLSMAFASYLAMEQIPMRIGSYLVSVSSSPLVVLLLINAILLVVGCFVDNISSMIILTPIFLPVVKNLGVDPIHFGLVMTAALAIGFVTPPYGANLFVASAISGTPIERISRSILPLVFVMTLCLLLFTLVPNVSIGLVKLLK